MQTLTITTHPLTIQDVINVARHKYRVELAEDVKERVNRSANLVQKFIDEERVIYGITTGFGKFSDVSISKEDFAVLQRNLIVSHSTGVGDYLDPEVVRAIIVLRINALSKGHSGIRLQTLDELMTLLNEDIIPCIPEKGSLGASGDLAPLSHMVSVLLGEGKCYYQGEIIPAKEMLERRGKKPYELYAKEGLALINGTQVMNAIGTLALYDAKRLLERSLVVFGITMETLQGIKDVFDPRLHQLRNQEGQQEVAAKMLDILKDSKRVSRQGELRVQDAYSLRCSPQVLGASLDALNYVEGIVTNEINAVTDNPIIFEEDEVAISGGNFHGQPLALAFDFLGIAVSELGNISERRIERLVNPQLSGLPGFLTEKPGLHSGFMIAQYSAAALVSENKVLAHPASVDSIPSSANQEDHVSMGTIAARKARQILTNVEYVLAIEFLCGCQGIDITKAQNEMATKTKSFYDALRQQVPKLEDDRFLADDFVLAREILLKEHE